MTVTRDVILDLWPLYEAGELSADSRSLVDRFLSTDPEFARMLRRAGDAARRALGGGGSSVQAAGERRVVEATRRRMAGQRWLAAGATFASLVPLSITNLGGRPRFAVLDHPALLLTLVVATGLWVWLWRMTRRP
jgi:hypothetical protein